MSNEHGPFMDAARTGEQIEFRGCVVRLAAGTVRSDGSFASGGPYIYANASHRAVGVVAVSVSAAGNLLVVTDGGSPIVFCTATPDETLTERGIWCGPSGGATNTAFVFYRVGTGRLFLNQQAHWNLVAGSLSNVWLGWASIAPGVT